jgi:histidinol phosphatase-like PHP family hydrolase
LKLKLDLHTHCRQANLNVPDVMTGVLRIVSSIQARGLHGIAITDHWQTKYAFRVKEIVDCLFNNSVLIIPGQEVIRQHQHVIELYLQNGYIFRFIAHPPSYSCQWYKHLEGIHGVEVRNCNEEHVIDEAKVREVAQVNDLLILSNSDAHELENIGLCYNEIEMTELYARAELGNRW